MLFERGQTILFQGDSITDCGRDYGDSASLGLGYPAVLAAWLTARHPELGLRFINRGISGNRVKDLQARWGTDTLDLRPDWVSVMIGVNDTWRRYDANDPTSAEDYEAGYRDLLTQVRDRLGARLILLEPFLLNTSPQIERMREDLEPKIRVVRQLAREFAALYVPLDGLFAAASAQREPATWSDDGVHPTPAGHAVIAQAWLRTSGVEG